MDTYCEHIERLRMIDSKAPGIVEYIWQDDLENQTAEQDLVRTTEAHFESQAKNVKYHAFVQKCYNRRHR